MALIRRLDKIPTQRDSIHGEAKCQYKVIVDDQGIRYLQIDTLGSDQRKMKGKTSQSMQFGPEGIAQLRAIIERERL